MSERKKKRAEEGVNLIGQQVLNDIFEVNYKRRFKIYLFNFWRGLFFGVGSFLGGTIVVALLIWLLTQFADVPGWLGQLSGDVVNIVD